MIQFRFHLSKKHLKGLSNENWNKQWIETNKASHTKLFFPTIYNRISAKHFKPNFISTQFISSHGNFKSYLIRFKLSDEWMCECERSLETPLHILLECDKYRSTSLLPKHLLPTSLLPLLYFQNLYFHSVFTSKTSLLPKHLLP